MLRSLFWSILWNYTGGLHYPPPSTFISTSRAGSTILCSGVCSGVSSGTIQEDSANPSSSKPGNKDNRVNISPEIQGVPRCFIVWTREGIPGRHELPLCRHEPHQFTRHTEPPPCSKSLRYTVSEPLLYIIVSLYFIVLTCNKDFFDFFLT